jgi:hypothetical protein
MFDCFLFYARYKVFMLKSKYALHPPCNSLLYYLGTHCNLPSPTSMETHPLLIALSSPIPVSPSFIYLHHPFHSSGYALPASFTNRQLSTGGHSNGKDYLDEVTEDEEEEEVGKVVVSVDMGDLGGTGTTTNSLSQKAFYNAVIRQLFTSISATLSLLDQRRSDTAKNATAQNPQLSPNRSRQKGLTGSTINHSSSLPGGAFASTAAAAAFHEKFAMISQKDIYRWDVFLVRVRAMMNAFHSALSVLPRHSRNGAEGADRMTISGGGEGSSQVSLTLVVLEAELLQKCLGGTWHAVLRLNEMVSSTCSSKHAANLPIHPSPVYCHSLEIRTHIC